MEESSVARATIFRQPLEVSLLACKSCDQDEDDRPPAYLQGCSISLIASAERW